MSKWGMVGRWLLAMLAATMAFYAMFMIVATVIVILAIVPVVAHLSPTVSIPETVATALIWGFSFAYAAAIIVGSAIVPQQHHIVARRIFSVIVVLVAMGSLVYARTKWFTPRLEGAFQGVILAWIYHWWQQRLKSGTLFGLKAIPVVGLPHDQTKPYTISKEVYKPQQDTVRWIEHLIVIQLSVGIAFAIYASIYLRGIQNSDIPSYLLQFESYVSVIVPSIHVHISALAGSPYESQIPFFRLTMCLIWGLNISLGLINLFYISKTADFYLRKNAFLTYNNGIFYSGFLGLYIVIAMFGIYILVFAVSFCPLARICNYRGLVGIISPQNLMLTALFSALLPHSIRHTLALLLYKFRVKQN